MSNTQTAQYSIYAILITMIRHTQINVTDEYTCLSKYLEEKFIDEKDDTKIKLHTIKSSGQKKLQNYEKKLKDVSIRISREDFDRKLSLTKHSLEIDKAVPRINKISYRYLVELTRVTNSICHDMEIDSQTAVESIIKLSFAALALESYFGDYLSLKVLIKKRTPYFFKKVYSVIGREWSDGLTQIKIGKNLPDFLLDRYEIKKNQLWIPEVAARATALTFAGYIHYLSRNGRAVKDVTNNAEELLLNYHLGMQHTANPNFSHGTHTSEYVARGKLYMSLISYG